MVFPRYGFLPWVISGLFFAANFSLSYLRFPILVKLWIFVLGLVIPSIAAWMMLRIERGVARQLTKIEFLPFVPLWGLGLLAGTAFFLRFYHLTTLSLWPLEDEAMNGYYAIELAEKGNWQFLYDFSGMPPLYVWCLALFFKLFGISLGTLWFLPALLSFLAVALVYRGAVQFFSKSFSLLFAGLIAFSFWPLYAGRFSLQGGFLVFWECLTFYLLASYWKTSNEKLKIRAPLLLGFCAGAGFYTFTSWAVVAFLLTLFIFGETAWKIKRRWNLFLYFFLPEAALFLLLACVTGFQKGGHFQYVLQNPFSSSLNGLNDFCSLFWGSRLPPNLFAYRPFWGGFLNPILGALCFWGSLLLCRSGHSPWKLVGLFFILILPGFLTGGLDSHRIIQVMPFLLFAVAIGLASLLSILPKSSRIFFLGACAVFSLGLDSHHLFGVYHSIWTHPDENMEGYKPVERGRAFEILKDLEKKQGPGYVLSDLVPETFDQSLSVGTYPFDASQNPKIDLLKAKWVALLTNIHYQPYLNQVFPEGRGTWLASDMGKPDGGFMLEIIPLPSFQPEVLQHWIQAGRAFHGLAGEVFDNHDWKPRAPIVQSLISLVPLLGSDKFLKSCFWEKIAQNEYIDRHYVSQVTAFQEAIEKGIPTAHLYNNLGALYLRRGHLKEARAAFQKALQCVPNHTSAAAGLKALDEMEKTGTAPAGIP